MCGGPDADANALHRGTTAPAYWVECPGCNIACTDLRLTPDEAAADWNRREKKTKAAMSATIPEALRKEAGALSKWGWSSTCTIMCRAADEIDKLRAQNARLKSRREKTPADN